MFFTTKQSIPLHLVSFLLTLGVLSSDACSIKTPITYQEGEKNRQMFLKLIWPILKSSEKSARIYYENSCQTNEGEFIPFPSVRMRQPLGGMSGAAAIRDVFRDDADVSVAESPPGIVRIWIGRPRQEVLGGRISTIRLAPTDRYDPQIAVDTIELSKDAANAARHFGVRPTNPMENILVVQPANDLVHLPPTLKDLTIDRALDQVATTFKGVVFYGACSNEPVFSLDFDEGVYAAN